MIDPKRVYDKIASWTAADEEGVRENFFEYRAALGDEATKTFREFAFGIAAQNILFEMIQNGEVSL